jgi:hypothetical protein
MHFHHLLLDRFGQNDVPEAPTAHRVSLRKREAIDNPALVVVRGGEIEKVLLVLVDQETVRIIEEYQEVVLGGNVGDAEQFFLCKNTAGRI